MGLRYQDKTAIITGAASGIGSICVVRFLQDGARVVATDIHAEGLEELVATADTGAGELVTIAGDVTQREDVTAIVARAVNAYGRLDVLVNAAHHCP
jgi:NAD(P)-dependent dehydrogenase (short-subunit alcohol dehydrogenase family)